MTCYQPLHRVPSALHAGEQLSRPTAGAVYAVRVLHVCIHCVFIAACMQGTGTSLM